MYHDYDKLLIDTLYSGSALFRIILCLVLVAEAYVDTSVAKN